jgi:signal transduction histidine kinase
VELPFLVLGPVGYARLAGLRGDAVAPYAALAAGLSAVKTVVLVGLLARWVAPLRRWPLDGDPGALSREEVARACEAAWRTPARMSLAWATAWGVNFPLLSLAASVALPRGALGPRLTTTLLMAVAAATSTLPLSRVTLAWLLSPVHGACSLRARAIGLDLAAPPLPLQPLLTWLTLLMAIAPTSWMAALAHAEGARALDLALFALLPLVWAPLCAGFLAGAIAGPIGRLASHLLRRSRHEPESTRPIPIYSHDEIGQVAASVNRLLTEHEERASALAAETLQRERLQEAARLQELFMAVLGHDLRHPLATVRLGAQALAVQPLPGDQRRLVEGVARAAERMRRLVADLLDFTRTRLGGGLPIEPREVDLRPLFGRVLDELRLAYPGRALTWMAAGDLAGRWDPDRIEQVLTNLVGNAVEHGAAAAPIRVAARGEPGGVTIEVANRGPPIPEALQPVIFDAFRRVEQPHGDGLGLGLYIVDQIARAHGGSVAVRSSDDETVFTVRLPRRAAAA